MIIEWASISCPTFSSFAIATLISIGVLSLQTMDQVSVDIPMVEITSQTDIQTREQEENQIKEKIKKAVENNTLFPPDEE